MVIDHDVSLRNRCEAAHHRSNMRSKHIRTNLVASWLRSLPGPSSAASIVLDRHPASRLCPTRLSRRSWRDDPRSCRSRLRRRSGRHRPSGVRLGEGPHRIASRNSDGRPILSGLQSCAGLPGPPALSPGGGRGGPATARHMLAGEPREDERAPRFRAGPASRAGRPWRSPRRGARR